MDENRILLEGRSALLICGVSDVNSFTETLAEIETALGLLQITGQTLHLDLLDLEKKEARLSGKIDSLWYPDDGSDKKTSFFARLFSK